MFPHSPTSAVPPDKLVQQLIVQALQAFYINDHETGVYFLQQIRTNLPRYMYQLNPQMRSLAKEVVKLLQDGSLVPDRSSESAAESAMETHPGLSGESTEYVAPAETVNQEMQQQIQQQAQQKANLASAPDLTETELEGQVVDTSQDVAFEPQTESVGTPAEEIPEQRPETPPQHPGAPITEPPYEETEAPRGTLPSDFITELSSAVGSVRDKKKKKKGEKLVGSMDELEDFDF
jgi:hypothetical protein